MKIKLLSCLVFGLLGASCQQESEVPETINFRQEMRAFVIAISEYAKGMHPDFYIVPQNGVELFTDDGESDGVRRADYLLAIDGQGQEDLFYGYDDDDQQTPSEESAYLKAFLEIGKQADKQILVTDYCSSPKKMEDAYLKNVASGYTSFTADDRELRNIPAYPSVIHQENNRNIITLAEVKNFLYLINPSQFQSKSDFIGQVTATNYDLLIMDLFFQDGIAFTQEEIKQLRKKANRGSRLLLAYISIGEAENCRYYWNKSWKTGQPSWLDKENTEWEGNYKVRYWQPEWQKFIYGNDESYVKRAMDAGFDGAYLDIIEAFEYYEQ